MKIKMFKKMLYFSFLLILNNNTVLASMRTDLTDRPPEEVLKKSLLLGSSLPCSKITGALVVNDGEELGTGVALDPYTILTAAHIKHLNVEDAKIEFVLSTNARGGYIKRNKDQSFEASSCLINIKNVHVHESFKRKDLDKKYLSTKYETDQLPYLGKSEFLMDLTYGGIPIGTLEELKFSEFKANFINCRSFEGVDLAILKLSVPLPDGLFYPSFVKEDDNIENMNGISVGFGTMVYNNQVEGPRVVSADLLSQNQRHVISCKVSSSSLEEGNQILYSEYKGLFINGDESFIPTDDMLMTTGLPVGGDSGGPFFIKIQDEYKLCGILSQTLAPTDDPIDDANYRSLLENVKQPIFPIWQDIRPYLPWIRSHMGSPGLRH